MEWFYSILVCGFLGITAWFISSLFRFGIARTFKDIKLAIKEITMWN